MLVLPREQGGCEADITQQSLPPKRGDGITAYTNQGTLVYSQGTSNPTTKMPPELVMRESIPTLHIRELADTSEVQRWAGAALDKRNNKLVPRSSDANEVSGAAYTHQMHVDGPNTNSSESSQNNFPIAEGNSTTTAEGDVRTPVAQPMENEDTCEQENTTVPMIEATYQVQSASSGDAAPNSAHEVVEDLGGKALEWSNDPQEMTSQQAPQHTDKVNEVQAPDPQMHQVDAHRSDSSSPLICDESSAETQRQSLQSSSPMPVQSSPLTSNPTPPSSVPSSPLIHSAVDVATSPVALDKLPQLDDLQSSGDSHLSMRQVEDSPAIAVSGTGLEKENKVQIVRSALPNPRHPTAISQRKQHEKLTTPFRPPTLVAPRRGPTDNTNKHGNQKDDMSRNATPPRRVLKSLPAAETDNRSKNKTSSAAIQFKSPLISRNALEVDSSIRLTPTIQMLERKLQILKRAFKVKEDKQEDQLRGLITKWTEAGREVAWELWEIVGNRSDGVHSGFMATGGKRIYEESWGWEMGSDKRFKEGEDRKPHSEGVNSGMEESDTMERVDLKGSDEDEDPDRSHYTLGTMLRQLGIDPQTLNWDDEEGAFKEVTDETQ